MAEATTFRNNALPYPVYAQAWTVVAPLLDADGDPISPSSPDSERSLNGDTFADCTNEATEIATSSGVVYLTLTAAEMTADIVAVRIQSTGAKTTILTLYPRKLPILSTGTCQGSNDTSDIQLASGDSAIDDTYNGCLCVAVIDGTTEARIINDYVGSTKVGEVSPAWNTAQPDSGDTYTIYLPEGRQVQAADVKAWLGTTAATPTVAGVPEVDVTHWLGTAAATPTTAGVPEVDVTYWRGTIVPAEHTAGYPVVTVKDGTGTGEINTNAGAIALVDLVTTTTTATTASAVTTLSSGAISEASFATTAGTFAPLGIIDQGTAQSATATTVVLRAAAAFADTTLVGATLAVFGSTQGYWQTRSITANTLSDDTATVDTWTVTPSGTITYKIFAGAPAPTTPPVVTLADTAHGGAAATLRLGGGNFTTPSFYVTNDDGSAVRFQSLGSATIGAGAGLVCDGTGTGTGISAQGGSSTGSGFLAQGGSGGGHGMRIVRGTAAADDLFLTNSDAPTLAAAVWAGVTRTLTSLDEDTTTIDLDATILAALGMASANLDTQIGDLPTNAELATALGTADDAVLTAIAALNNVSNASVASAVLTTAMTEAYRSAGATATLAQFAYEVIAHLGESTIAGTTKTLKKLDAATTAKVYTLNDATTPTSITETS